MVHTILRKHVICRIIDENDMFHEVSFDPLSQGKEKQFLIEICSFYLRGNGTLLILFPNFPPNLGTGNYFEMALQCSWVKIENMTLTMHL